MFSVSHAHKLYRSNVRRRRQKVIKKRRIKALIKAIAAAWKDFCTTSSFVGFRYVYRKHRTTIDVLFWFLLMPILMYCAVIFVVVFLDRYRAMSTTTIVRSQHTPSSRAPFPGVTACLSSRISKTRLNAFLAKYDGEQADYNLTEANFIKFLDPKQVPDLNALTTADRFFSTYNLTFRDLFDRTMNDCEEIFTICRFAGEITPCSRIFKITAGANCCSFNYPTSLESLQHDKLLRTKTFGLHGGLSFAFKTFPDEQYYKKIHYGNTLRVTLHAAHSFPTLNFNNFLMSKSMENALEIDGVANSADHKVGSLPFEYRDCIFAFEKSLPNFVRFSYSNCLLQCMIDRIKFNCGCAAHFLPKSNDSEICPMKQLPCLINCTFVGIGIGGNSDCDCRDDCYMMKYNAKISTWDFSTMSNYSVDDFYANVTNDQGIVHIFLGKSTVLYLQRKLAFDEIELASNIGGIVAIFLGCSFVTVTEIIYFLTIRLLKFYNSLD